MGCGTCAGRSERVKKQTQQQQTGERQATTTKKVSKKGAGATFSSQTKCMATRTACILFKNTIFLPSGQVGYLHLPLLAVGQVGFKSLYSWVSQAYFSF